MTSFSMGDAYAQPPYTYHRDQDISVVFATDPAAVAALLPPALSVDSPARGLVRFVQQRFSPFGPYCGVYLSVFARYRDETVVFGVAGLKSNPSGVIAGREIWGMPLKVGTVEMRWQDNVLSATAGRVAGSPVCRVAARIDRVKPPRDQPEPMIAAVYRRRFPAAAEGEPDVDELVHVVTQEGSPAPESFRVTASVALADVADDAWSILPVERVIGGRYTRGGSSVLPRGRRLPSP